MTKPQTSKAGKHSETTTDMTAPLAALAGVSNDSKPVSLYDAETALVTLEDALAQAAEDGTEVSEEQLEAAANAFLEATNAAKDAVERYCWLIFNRLTRSDERKAQAKVWESKAKDLKTIAQQDESLAQRLKQKLLAFLDRREIAKLETTTFKLSARNNGGKQPLTVDEDYSIQDIAQFYPNLLRLEIDKDAVRTFLENGGALPFARLEERGRSLVIKP
jgi:hypothetical protein